MNDLLLGVSYGMAYGRGLGDGRVAWLVWHGLGGLDCVVWLVWYGLLWARILVKLLGMSHVLLGNGSA